MRTLHFLVSGLLMAMPGIAAAEEAAAELPAAAETSAEPDAAITPPEPSRTVVELAEYEAAIRDLEAEGGPFHPQIPEILTAAAAALTEGGRFDEAVAFLRRALYIRRSHSGLYDLAHVEILEQIIENDFALGDADALDRDYQHMYWIYRRNFGGNDPRLVPLLEHIAAQRVRTYHAAGRGHGTLHHAIVADEMNDRARVLLEPIAEAERTRYIAALQRTAVINYLVAKDALDNAVSIREIRAAMLEAKRPMFDTDEPQVREQIAQDAFYKGALALKAASKLAREREMEEPAAAASALAFEGDWYWVFRRKWDASRRYEEAWRVLENAAVPAEEVERLFGQPRRLEPLTMPDENQTPSGAYGWVEALIIVTDSGWPDHIQVTSTFPVARPELRDRGALGIAAVMYRPRMEAGKPVTTADVPIRYYFER